MKLTTLADIFEVEETKIMDIKEQDSFDKLINMKEKDRNFTEGF